MYAKIYCQTSFGEHSLQITKELVEIRVIGGRGLVFSGVSRSIRARNEHSASVYADFGGSWKAVSALRPIFRRTAA